MRAIIVSQNHKNEAVSVHVICILAKINYHATIAHSWSWVRLFQTLKDTPALRLEIFFREEDGRVGERPVA